MKDQFNYVPKKDLVDLANNLETLCGHTGQMAQSLHLMADWLNLDSNEGSVIASLGRYLEVLNVDLRKEVDRAYDMARGGKPENTKVKAVS